MYFALAAVSPAQTFKELAVFDGTNGSDPTNTDLVQGIDGELYGTTQFGGAANLGTVFKINSAGTLTTLWSFCKENGCPDGDRPMAGLTVVPGGDLYGTTYFGGAHGAGTIFKITPAGALTTVHSFCASFGCADGLNPDAALLLAADGNLYGTTVLGGTGGCGGCHGGGIAFKISLSGTFTKIHDFCTGSCPDASNPSNALTQASDGNFYSEISGRYGYYAGNVFRMTPAGKVTVLYTFCKLTNCPGKRLPSGRLVQGANGDLYGTTAWRREIQRWNVLLDHACGAETVLHNFAQCDGQSGFQYELRGDSGLRRELLRCVRSGRNRPLHLRLWHRLQAFTPAGDCADRTLLCSRPSRQQWRMGAGYATNGPLFAALTSSAGGPSNAGTVYQLSDGLAAFVKLVATNGKVGTTVDILGEGFTGATGVAFDGVKATFTNVSDTFITAAVPKGALTGTVTVTTFTKTYKSNHIFRVTPQLTSFSPASATVGATVTLTGVSLTQTTAVTIGGLPAASFKVVSDTSVTAIVPAGAKTKQNIVVTTAGGSASKGPLAIPPKIGSFSPSSGPVGTEVIIKGNTFTGTTEVTIGGVAASSFEVINDTQLGMRLFPAARRQERLQ